MEVLRVISLMVFVAAVATRRSNRVARQAAPGIGCSQLADLIFLYDGSDSMTTENYVQEQDFIINVLNRLYLNPVDGIVAGAVVFETETQEVRLKPFKPLALLTAAIRALPHGQGGTLTNLGIERVRDIFTRDGRPDVPKIMILLTDGRSKNGTATLEQAAKAKEEDIEIIAVGIGTRIDFNELTRVVSSPEKFLTVPDFNQLGGLTLNISKTVCPETTTTTTTTTTTPVPTTTTTTTTTPSGPNPCDDCRFLSGLAYARHETECYLFYQCVGVGAPFRPVLKRCPWGQFWDQEALTCKPASQVQCPTDPCLERFVTSYGMTTTCRGYWECIDGRTNVPSCCGVNERFIQGQGCVFDLTCDDECPYVVKKFAETTCTGLLRPFPGDVSKFFLGGRLTSCPPGLTFSEVTCWCSVRVTIIRPANDPACRPDIHLPFDENFNDFSSNNLATTPEGNVMIVKDPNMGMIGGGAAKFEGGKLTLWTYANRELGNVFAISFRYLEIPRADNPNKPESIVSNSDCRTRCTVAVALDRPNAMTEGFITTDKSGRKIAAVQQRGITWKDVELRYNGTALTLTVDGIKRLEDTNGYIQKAQAALQLGNSCREFASFHGYVDEFKVYKDCLP